MKTAGVLLFTLFLHLISSIAFAQLVVFEDTFDGNAGDPPDASKWGLLGIGGGVAAELTGNGFLELDPGSTATWNSPAIESIYHIPGDGAADFEVEFIIQETADGYNYLSVFPTVGGLSNARGFFTQGETGGSPNAGKIHCDTSQSGTSGYGSPTDSMITPNNAVYGLKMILRGDGSMDWYYNIGSGYTQLTQTNSVLDSWSLGEEYKIHIDANGYNGVGALPILLIDRITIRNLTVPVELSSFSVD